MVFNRGHPESKLIKGLISTKEYFGLYLLISYQLSNGECTGHNCRADNRIMEGLTNYFNLIRIKASKTAK